MIDGKNFSDQPVKNNKTTYENIRKIATGQTDDYSMALRTVPGKMLPFFFRIY